MPEYEVTYLGTADSPISPAGAEPLSVQAESVEQAVQVFHEEINATLGEYRRERFLVNDIEADDQTELEYDGEFEVIG